MVELVQCQGLTAMISTFYTFSARFDEVYAVLVDVSSQCAFDEMFACHEVGGKSHPQKSPSGSSETCLSNHEDGEILSHGDAVNVM